MATASTTKINRVVTASQTHDNTDVVDKPFTRNSERTHQFLNACEYGYQTTAFKLHSLGGVDIHMYNNHAFTTACENGHEGIAR